MIKAWLTKKPNGTYVIETEQGRLKDLGRRKPSKRRQRQACAPALNEEVQIEDRTAQI